MIRHHTIEKVPKLRTMVAVLKMTKLMNKNIVDAWPRSTDDMAANDEVST